MHINFLPQVISVLFALSTVFSIAQPSNDNCTSAQVITIPASGSTCFNSTNAGATSDLTTNACDTGTPGNEVWYTYIATGGSNSITITPNGATPATNVVVSIQGTPCASGVYSSCGSGTGSAAATTSFAYAIGTQVYFSVETNGTDGTFQVCVNSISQPAAPGNSCATATPICNKNTFTVNPFPQNINVITPGCFPSPFQRPLFYKFTVGQAGSCIWTVDPIGNAEYDWVMYDITNGCPGTEVCCNFNYASSNGSPVGMATGGAGACGTSGFAGAPGEFSPPANVVMGNTYLIVIDNYSDNTVGFTMSWGGTFDMAPNPEFTLTPSTGCAPLTVGITNQSTATTTYSWTMGNGNTSVAASPPSQTYANAGTYIVSLVATSTTGCTNVMTHNVVVNASPVMNPVSNQTVCANSSIPLTTFGSSITGTTYAWTNSTTGIGLAASGTGNLPAFTAVNNTSAPLTATITVTPTANGCSGTPITFTITVNPIPVMTAVSNLAQCGGPVSSINFSSTPTGSSFAWTNSNASIGLGASGTGNLPAFTGTNATSAPISGTISVTPTLNSCVGSPTSFTITINPTPVITAVTSTSYCPGNTVPATSITVTPATATISWGNSTPTIGLAASGNGATIPSFTATNSSANALVGTITVNAVANGCNAVASTFNITVNLLPVMGSLTNQSACNGNQVNVPAFSSTPSNATFAWTNSNTAIGLGSSGSNAIAGFTGTNPTTSAISGTITVTPTIGSCVGSPGTFTITINPDLTPAASNNGPLCAGQTMNLTTTGPAGASYSWTGPNGYNSAVQNPSFVSTTSSSGTYTVTVTQSGCSGTATTNVTINPSQTPTINAAGPICQNASSIFLTASVAGGIWSGTGIVNASTGEFNPGSATIGNNTITYTLAGSCSVPGTSTIVVNAVPVVSFNSPDLSGCLPFTTSLVDLSNPMSNSLIWDFGDGTTSTQTGTVSHTFNSAGCYTITLTSTSSGGCTSSASVPNYICVIPNAIAAFGVDNTIHSVLNPTFTMFNSSTNATFYNWNFGDGTTSTVTNPSHLYDAEGGTYTISLVANNAGNCPDTAYMTIQIEDELIYYVPNAFTPDGDEFNNSFQPVFTAGFDPQNFELLIYNRWGETVFESHNAAIGWDGTYHGEYCKEGIYTWVIKFKDSENDKKFVLNGHVTILK
jgi:gliding motility-associated-like protein